jgi:hypothetical protein
MFICSRCSAENNPAITFWEKAEEPNKIWATCSACNTYALHNYYGAHSLGMKGLLDQRLAVVDIVARTVDKARHAISDFVVRPIPPGESEIFYVKLIGRLASVQLSPDEALMHWGHILDHKWYMSENQGRDVGIEVAALDYFKNILPAKQLTRKK